ncbi:MAG: Coenzyme F420 hydrogenase/dehydrogenase, beta subunit C-terminal domain [Candidatus Syntropharchaeales archaeon]
MRVEKSHALQGFELLKKEIIDTGLCTGCGACAAFCGRIEMINGRPELVKPCILEMGSIRCGDQGTCYDHCSARFLPTDEIEEEFLGMVREDEDLGVYRRIISARSTNEEILKVCQDGGVVTALLAYGFEKGIFDGAVVTRGSEKEKWRPEPALITSFDELMNSAGTIYAVSPNIEALGKAIKETRLSRIAVVGTPCHTTAVRNIQSHLLRNIADLVEITSIGVFCMENFEYGCIRSYIDNKVLKDTGLTFDDVDKTAIMKGMFFSYTKEDVYETALPGLHRCVRDSCDACTDFSAELADISVGSVGSKAGWSTVITRSEKGDALIQAMIDEDYLDTEEPNVKIVRRLAKMKFEKPVNLIDEYAKEMAKAMGLDVDETS